MKSPRFDEKFCIYGLRLDFFDDFVFAVDANDGGFPGLGFFRRHRCISYDNYEVAWLYQASRGTVQANYARTSFAFDYISIETGTIIDIKDANFFEGEDACCIHQIAGYSDGTFIVEVSISYSSTMNFGFK